jgi:hypothetical protein
MRLRTSPPFLLCAGRSGWAAVRQWAARDGSVGSWRGGGCWVGRCDPPSLLPQPCVGPQFLDATRVKGGKVPKKTTMAMGLAAALQMQPSIADLHQALLTRILDPVLNLQLGFCFSPFPPRRPSLHFCP